jgi:MFS family permease
MIAIAFIGTFTILTAMANSVPMLMSFRVLAGLGWAGQRRALSR